MRKNGQEVSGSDRVSMLTPVQTLTGPQWTSEPDHGSMIVRTNGTMGGTLGSGLCHTQTTYRNIESTNHEHSLPQRQNMVQERFRIHNDEFRPLT